MSEAPMLLSLGRVLPKRLLALANYRFDLSTQHTPYIMAMTNQKEVLR